MQGSVTHFAIVYFWVVWEDSEGTGLLFGSARFGGLLLLKRVLTEFARFCGWLSKEVAVGARFSVGEELFWLYFRKSKAAIHARDGVRGIFLLALVALLAVLRGGVVGRLLGNGLLVDSSDCNNRADDW